MISPGNLGKKNITLLIIALYACIGLLIYSNVLSNGVFMFDDFEYIVGNNIIHDPLSVFLDLTDTRQIGYLSFAMNYAIGGEDPTGFHIVNVLIHIINAVLVFYLIGLLLKRLGGEKTGPDKWHQAIVFFAGLLFLVHPLQTQAVSYVTQRFTSLVSMFYLLSVVFYLTARVRTENGQVNNRTYAIYWTSFLSALLAMKTKEIAFTIPFVLCLFEYLLFRDSKYEKRRFYFLIPHAASIVLVPFAIFGPDWGLTRVNQGITDVTRTEKMYDLFERPLFEYLYTQFSVVVTYLRLLLAPVNQSVIYNIKASRSFFEPKAISSFCLLVFIMMSAVYIWRRSPGSAEKRLFSLGIAWFFVTISVESSFIPIKDLIFEHRVYLPSVGFFASCCALAAHCLRNKLKRCNFNVAAVAAVIVVIVLSIATYSRNNIWTDEVIFWDDVVKKFPDKAIGYHNRGNAYIKISQYELALRDIDKTITFFPDSSAGRNLWENSDYTPSNMAKTYMNRGKVYRMLGQFEKADADYAQARYLIDNFPGRR